MCAISISTAYCIHTDGKLPHLPVYIGFLLQQWWIFHLPIVYGGSLLREVAHWDCCILSLLVTHRLLSAILWFCSPWQAMLLHIVGVHLTLISHCSGNTESEIFTTCRRYWYPPSVLSYSVLPLLVLYHFACSSSVGKCSFQSPCPNRLGGWSGGELRWWKITTETGWKGKRKETGLENKVALIRTCQEQCAHKAALESNLVVAVSLSDMSAISCHRSECELGALSDFLKSHKWKRKGMTSPQEKK